MMPHKCISLYKNCNGNTNREPVKSSPLTLPNVERATETGMINANTPNKLRPNVCKEKESQVFNFYTITFTTLNQCFGHLLSNLFWFNLLEIHKLPGLGVSELQYLPI